MPLGLHGKNEKVVLISLYELEYPYLTLED